MSVILFLFIALVVVGIFAFRSDTKYERWADRYEKELTVENLEELLEKKKTWARRVAIVEKCEAEKKAERAKMKRWEEPMTPREPIITRRKPRKEKSK